MVLVKGEQGLFELVAGLCGVSSPSKAITELPRFLVKVRATPLKASHRSITENEVVSFTVFWHPSCTLWW
jgi:hypothetical protein